MFQDDREKPERLPARIRVGLLDDDPFGTPRPVLEAELARKEGEQVFPLPKPEMARFVRVEFLLGPGQTGSGIGAVSAYEGTRDGYVGVAVRGGIADSLRERKEEKLVLDGEAKREAEPNDAPGSASSADPKEWNGGRLETAGDRDLWRFRLALEGDDSPVLELRMAPYLRARVRVLDVSGNEVRALDLTPSGGRSASVPLPLPPGEYLLELRAAPANLLLGVDTSGSMGGTFKTLSEAIRTWADGLPEGYRVALATSRYDRTAKRFYTIACPFTSDREKLRAASVDMFRDAGGTSDWYSVLGDLLEVAHKQSAKDSVGTLVYVADGNGSGEFLRMWERLRECGIRVYTIGFGNVGEAVDNSTSWNGGRGLFNVAWYRGGRYYAPKSHEELAAACASILEDLQSPVEYAFRIRVKKRGIGTLATLPPPGEDRPIHFILDASGSMMAKCGDRTRFDVAREVIAKVVEALPAETPVGLRVYGHRFPTTEPEKAAKDSELVIPIGKLDREKLGRILSRLRARGGTPPGPQSAGIGGGPEGDRSSPRGARHGRPGELPGRSGQGGPGPRLVCEGTGLRRGGFRDGEGRGRAAAEDRRGRTGSLLRRPGCGDARRFRPGRPPDEAGVRRPRRVRQGSRARPVRRPACPSGGAVRPRLRREAHRGDDLRRSGHDGESEPVEPEATGPADAFPFFRSGVRW